MSREPVRVALLGAGAMGRAHLEALRADPRIEVAHVCDADANAAAEAAACVGAHATEDPTRAIEMSDIDIVDICLPHDLHADLACLALEAGKGVVCEKPIGVTVDQADRVIETIERTNGRFFLKSYLRHSEPFNHLREAVTTGAIGEVSMACGTFLSGRRRGQELSPTWREEPARGGGGVLIDCAVHLVDVAHWCFGVESHVRSLLLRDDRSEHGTEGEIAVLLAYEWGLAATVVASWYAAVTAPVYAWTVLGDRGSAEVAPLPNGSLAWSVRPTDSEPAGGNIAGWWEAANTAAVRAGVDWVLNEQNRGDSTTARQATAALTTIEQAYDLLPPDPVRKAAATGAR